jgi:hypothetical protein
VIVLKGEAYNYPFILYARHPIEYVPVDWGPDTVLMPQKGNFLFSREAGHTKSDFSQHGFFISGPKSYLGNAEKRSFVSVECGNGRARWPCKESKRTIRVV